MKPRIYNRNMEMVGVLENASAISYVHKHNDLFTASFELPFDDPKTELCDTHFIVDIFDGENSKGKYRILDEPDEDITSEGQMAKYSCEHVIAYLLNDVIDGYMETGGYYTRTRAVLEQLLNRQTVRRWVLGRCDFDRQFQYSWENTNLLDAIFSVPTCFDEEYHWTYDTDTYPWTLNLISQDTDRSCEIRRKRNMQQIKREKDASALITRLYCKGYGEGVNQLTIAEVNNGLPYIDADTIDRYGVICGHLIDHRFTHAETLLARGQAVLEGCKHPRYTYTAKAIDLNKITGLPWDEFEEGKYVHIVDEEKKLGLDAMIVEVSKSDIDGDPLDIDITISNKSSDTSDAIEDLAHRTSIAEQYSQGATNLYAQQYSDNASPDYPAVMRVYIPAECERINKMLLSWKLSAFRAYETGAEAGGATATTTESGGATTVTSSDGGATTVTSSDGGATTVTSSAGGSEEVTSRAGGGKEQTSGSGGSQTIVEEQKVITTEASTGGAISGHSGDTSGNTGWAINASGSSVTSTDEAGGHDHNMQHYHSGPSHTHSINGHTHSGPSHNHGMGHFHNGPSHTHSIDSHTHTGPSHTHTGPSHSHSFSGTQNIANGHTHKVVCSSSGTTVTSQGVSTNATHNVKISGTTGNAGTGSTGEAGTGNTSAKSLTTNESGTGMTGNAITSGGGSRVYTTDSGTGETSSTSLTTNSDGTGNTGYAYYAGTIRNTVSMAADHAHGMAHRHNFSHSHNVVAVVRIPAITINIPSHTHGVSIPSHTHDVIIPSHEHDVTLGNHIHSVTLGNHSHSVSIDNHSHTVTINEHTHNISIGDHTHEIVYGIYTGSIATGVRLSVDGNDVPVPPSEGDVDIVSYLSTDANGKISRGVWHEIEIVPDGLTRIEANLFVQTFVNSFTGGNY